MIARAIISRWGWGYFFYIAKLEFKKQKLSILKPDGKPIPLFYRDSFQSDYEKYLDSIENKIITNLDKTKLNQIKITFFIFCDVSQINNLKSTVKSFFEQDFNNWNIVLLIEDNDDQIDLKQFQNDNKISILSDFNNDVILKKISEFEPNFIGFINSNVILPSYSLNQFSTFMHNSNDFDIFYCDHDFIDKNKKQHKPFFKPDWSLVTFRSFNYLFPLCLIKKTLVEQTLKNNSLSNCFIFDLLLHCINLSKKIFHIPLPLCSLSTEITFSDNECKKRALENNLKENKIDAKIESGLLPNTFRIHYNLKSQPKVSILIPTKNNRPILKRCIDSIEKNTNYKNIEIIIIDSPVSDIYFDPTLKKYYEQIPHKTVTYNGNFNFSKMNNLAVKEATGDLLLFLNDDTKILDDNWLNEMVSILLEDDVGVVGPKLIFDDDTIQHAGITFLKTGSGFHPFMKLDDDAEGYCNFANIMKECLAVTGACLLTKRSIFEQVGQFDEDFDVYYGDSDLCLKIRRAGYKIIYTPFTKLLHEGSFTIRSSGASYFAVEAHQRFLERWPELKNGDPFYHPALDWDYSISKIR
ncbi:glycosyltransferase family 2 protein [Nitrosopumilus sp. b2]|uniref:glycosyltransferase family 2 protein n=1 Tax=Nitrosopumilus sp. b2 TaxID=2109908 RepID=UPI0015F39689|nr:glycosyltransferase family 2 protein [Nitrosopumilus sp. b2]